MTGFPFAYFAPVRFDPENAAGTGIPWKEVLVKLQEARRKARAVWLLADCCRSAPGLRGQLVARARDLKQGVEEGGNLIVCAASSGDNPSYESEDLKHGIFTQAWLDALRGGVPENVRGLYDLTPRGRALTLTSLETLVDLKVRSYARKAGKRQKVDFPSGLFVSFEPSMPVFMPIGR